MVSVFAPVIALVANSSFGELVKPVRFGFALVFATPEEATADRNTDPAAN
jgi:hypothetical protein